MPETEPEPITVRVTEREVSIDSWPRYARFSSFVVDGTCEGVELRIIVRDSREERAYRVTRFNPDFLTFDAELIEG